MDDGGDARRAGAIRTQLPVLACPSLEPVVRMVTEIEKESHCPIAWS